MVEAKIKARCRFGCRAGCRSGCRAKIPKALILRHFSLSDNHDNQYYKEKGYQFLGIDDESYYVHHDIQN